MIPWQVRYKAVRIPGSHRWRVMEESSGAVLDEHEMYPEALRHADRLNAELIERRLAA